MKLAVSTRSGLYIVDANTEEVTTVPVFTDDWYPYGITWNYTEIYIALRAVVPTDETKERILVLDKNWEYITEHVIGRDVLGDTHQIQWHDGSLWIVASNLNHVVIMDKQGKYKVWEPNPEAPYNEKRNSKDWNHFNSIWFSWNRLYLVAHNFERPSEIWEFTYPGKELVQIHPADTNTHNVCMLDGKLITAARNMDSNVYSRGIAICDTYIFLGRSDMYIDRATRHTEARGYIAMFDRAWNKIKEIPMGKGEVYEIRLLDIPDIAHHGMVLQDTGMRCRLLGART